MEAPTCNAPREPAGRCRGDAGAGLVGVRTPPRSHRRGLHRSGHLPRWQPQQQPVEFQLEDHGSQPVGVGQRINGGTWRRGHPERGAFSASGTRHEHLVGASEAGSGQS